MSLVLCCSEISGAALNALWRLPFAQFRPICAFGARTEVLGMEQLLWTLLKCRRANSLVFMARPSKPWNL